MYKRADQTEPSDRRFTCSLVEQILSTYCVPGTVLGLWDIGNILIGPVPSWGFWRSRGGSLSMGNSKVMNGLQIRLTEKQMKGRQMTRKLP